MPPGPNDPEATFERIVTRRQRRQSLPSRPPAQTTASTYRNRETHRGPQPPPSWVITSDQALDTDLGVLKTGKEADVSIVERRLHGEVNVLAVKRYRPPEHRDFRNDSVYRAGRRLRDRRAQKAVDQGSSKGEPFKADEWAAWEFDALAAMWAAHAAVPYPVQRRGTEVMLEFLGDDDGPAPRLVDADIDASTATELFEQARELLALLAELGIAHADLSAYNLLVWHDRLYAIDFPQASDLITNPMGLSLLHRDVSNVCGFFARRGVVAARDPEALFGTLVGVISRRP